MTNIEKIEIKRHVDSEDGDKWSVNLIKFQGDSTEIYITYYKLDAEMLAKKISKLTGK